MKYKASALACLIFAFAFPLFSASSVYESRLFGKVSATQGRDEVVLQCESAQKARECASKYMTDILLFGTAVPEGNAIRLKSDAYCRISVSGNRVVIRFASSLKNFPALEEGESITEANRYPRWYDRFDNDAAAVGFFGWGNLPRDTYGDFAWARRYFRRMLHPLACEADYLAPRNL